MEVGNFVKSTIGIIVVLIVIVSVAVPIISQMESGVSEHSNNTTQSYAMDDETETTVTVECVSTSSYKINNKTYTLTAESATLWVVADSVWMQMRSVGCNIFGVSGFNNITMSAGDIMTFSAGSWAYDGANSRTGSYTTLLYPADKGPLGMFTAPVWIDDDATWYAFCNIPIANDSDGKARQIFALTSTTGSTTTIIADSIYTTGVGYDQNIAGTLTVSPNATGKSTTAATQYSGATWTYTPTSGDPITSSRAFIVAPITYTTLVGSETPVGAMISIIPILMIVGLIVAVIALFLRRSEA